MPSINGSLGPAGPTLTVLIGLSLPHAMALKKTGKAPPAYVHGTFLIDTGASCTCMDPRFVAPLGLTQTGSVGMLTPSTNNAPVSRAQYDVSIFLPGANGAAGHFIDALPVIECDFSAQGIDGLIGRDVLDKCTLIYNGSAKSFTLAY